MCLLSSTGPGGCCQSLNPATMQDVAEKLAAAQSHTSHRVVAFEPLAPAALFVRIALTFAAIRVRHGQKPCWGSSFSRWLSRGYDHAHVSCSCTACAVMLASCQALRVPGCSRHSC
jgi:hypothetical protein